MSTTPQAKPTADDLAREQYYATIAATTPPPATYKGRVRGKTKDSSWRTNIGLWEAYPALPIAPLAKGDKPAADAWLRMEAIIVQKMFEEKPGSQAANWNPNKVTWPLPTPPASWGSGSKFAARRPWKKTVPQTRYHTGIDLAASPGTPVLAPESGTIIAPNSGWEYNAQTGKGVKALIMQTDSGLTILLGGIRPDSAIVKAGQKVAAGEKLAEIGRYPLGDSMLHFTLHNALLSEAEVNARKSWPYGQPQPANVIDPASYLGAAANNPRYATVGLVQQPDGPGLVPNDVEGGELFEGTEETMPFVSASDGRTGTKPCVGKVCVKADAIAWYNALKSYYGAAHPLYVYASALPNQIPAVVTETLKDAASQLSEENYPSSPEEAQIVNWATLTSEYLNLTYAVREVIDTLTAFVASASAPGNEQAPDDPKNPGPLPPLPPQPPAKTNSGGGSLGIVAGLGAVVLVLGVTAFMLSKKSRASRAAAVLMMFALSGGCGPMAPDLSTTSTTSSSSTAASGHEPSSRGSAQPTETPTTSASSTGTGEDATSTSTSTSTASTIDGSSGPPDTDLPGGCECQTNADCTGGAICGPGGICIFSCDPLCPVACQMAPPNFCEPPCHIPCPLGCTSSGVCPLCLPADDAGPATTAETPTGG